MSSTGHTCKSCGAEIVWTKLAGRWHPCDPKRISIVASNRLITGHESHFATCPNAAEHRRGGAKGNGTQE